MIEMTNQDYAHYLLGDDIDLDAQLLAVRDLMRRHSAASDELSREITELAEAARAANGPYAEHLVDLSVDRMHGSVYQDAAHSMAAAGMLAPLMESILVRLFQGISLRPWPLTDETRKALADATDAPSDMWNAQSYFSKNRGLEKNIVTGTRQLSEATGLDAFLPIDFGSAFEALVLYRNKMFHNGFEWPIEMRVKFQTLIEQKGWQDWFSSSSTDHKPWIFYMSPAFIQRAVALVEETLDAAGRLVRERTDRYGYERDIPVLPDELAFLFETDRGSSQ